MKLYVSHSTNFDYRNDLYAPLAAAFDGAYELIFPHSDTVPRNSKEAIRSCDAVLAEVSYPSTGQGIELGWADDAKVPVICMRRSGAESSSALQFIASNIVEYVSEDDMLDAIRPLLAQNTPK